MSDELLVRCDKCGNVSLRPALLNDSFDILFFPMRAFNVLCRAKAVAGVSSIKDVCYMTPAELMRYRGCGRVTVTMIEKVLNGQGLRLGFDYDRNQERGK